MPSTKYDKNWKTIGHVSDDGKTLYDEHWNVIGHVSDDGKTIHDKNWSVTGHLSDDRKTLYDKEWNTIGHVSNDGKTIYDKNWDVAERSNTSSPVTYVPKSPPSYRSSSGEANWVVWLIGALIVLAIIYLIFVVVVPFIILDIPTIALLASFIVANKKTILQWTSVIGLLYLFVDIQGHWLSHHLVKNIEVSQLVIDYIFYINTAGGLLAAFFLIHAWFKAKYPSPTIVSDTPSRRITDATKYSLYSAGGLAIVGVLLVYVHIQTTPPDANVTYPPSSSIVASSSLPGNLPSDFAAFFSVFHRSLQSHDYNKVVNNFDFPVGGYLSGFNRTQCIANMKQYWRNHEWIPQNIQMTNEGISVDFPNADLSFQFLKKGNSYRVVAVYSNLEGGD